MNNEEDSYRFDFSTLSGIWSVFPSQFQTIDSILSSHYNYLKNTIVEVLKIGYKNMDELNYCIYLLDRDLLPLNETEIVRTPRTKAVAIAFA